MNIRQNVMDGLHVGVIGDIAGKLVDVDHLKKGKLECRRVFATV